MKSLGRVWNQQCSCEVSRKSLGTNRIAVQFHGIVKGIDGSPSVFRCTSTWECNEVPK